MTLGTRETATQPCKGNEGKTGQHSSGHLDEKEAKATYRVG